MKKSRKKFTIDTLFNERLKFFLIKLNIKRKLFCESIGISTGYLTMILNGQRGPSAELIAGLFIHYGDYLDWLLTGKNDPFTNENLSKDESPANFSGDMIYLKKIYNSNDIDLIDIIHKTLKALTFSVQRENIISVQNKKINEIEKQLDFIIRKLSLIGREKDDKPAQAAGG